MPVAFELLIDRHQGKSHPFQCKAGSPTSSKLRILPKTFSFVSSSSKNVRPHRKVHDLVVSHCSQHRIQPPPRLCQSKRSTSFQSGNSSTAGVLLENIAIAPSGFQPARSVDKTERSPGCLTSIAGARGRQRTAILLSKFEGMSTKKYRIPWG